MTRIEPAKIELIPSFYDCLKFVANEKIYIEMIEPPPLDKVTQFQTSLIEKQGPIFYAVENQKVVGWCDIFPAENPRQNHRGSLGMGLLPDYRGRGLGTQLLLATLKRAQEFGLEKVELHVYTTNEGAIALYRKLGFVQEGLIRRYRKLDGRYFDCLAMGKFLNGEPGQNTSIGRQSR